MAFVVAAIVTAGVIGAGATIYAANKQIDASANASNAQITANDKAIALQQQEYADTVARNKPWYDAGTTALTKLQAGVSSGAYDPGVFTPTVQSDTPFVAPTNTVKGFTSPVQPMAAFAPTTPVMGQFSQTNDPGVLNTSSIPDPGTFSGKVDLNADPGYQFRQQQGQLALDKTAAARGLVESGSQQKAIAGYSQGLASQEYQNAYNRAYTEYGTTVDQYGRKVGAMTADYNSKVNQQNMLYNEAIQAYNANLNQNNLAYNHENTTYNTNLSANNQNFNQGLQEYNANLAGQGQNYNEALSTYNTNLSQQQQLYNQQLQEFSTNAASKNQNYNNLLTLSNVGQIAAGQINNTNANTTNATSNLLASNGNSLANMFTGQAAATSAGVGGVATSLNQGLQNYLLSNYLKNKVS